MADYAALKEAERLVDEAEKLSCEIDRELAPVSSIIAQGKETLSLIAAASRELSDHVTYLGKAATDGYKLKNSTIELTEKTALVQHKVRQGSGFIVRSPEILDSGYVK